MEVIWRTSAVECKDGEGDADDEIGQDVEGDGRRVDGLQRS